MIADQARLDELLARVRHFVRDVAIPNEDRVEREDHVGEDLVAAMRKISGHSAGAFPGRTAAAN